MGHPNSTCRLFLALWPDIALQKKLHTWRKQCVWTSGASLVLPESLHLTLHFLGNIAQAKLPELVQGLRVSFSPFELNFSTAQMWQHGVAILKPDAVSEDLLHLHTTLKTALQRLNVAIEDRAYRPHITVARHAGGAVFSAAVPDLKWHVDHYALVQSQHNRYLIIQSYR